MTAADPLLTTKELAAKLGRCRHYVYWMRVNGFRMPGGTATLSEAREWLDKNPAPCAKRNRQQA